jgi:hypothetical protein
VCPKDAPYSPRGSTACTACVGTPLCNATYGFFACPGMGWSPWMDDEGVEGSNSCILGMNDGLQWTAAEDACASSAPGAHLATFRQVQPTARDKR